MSYEDNSIFSKDINPFRQFLIVMGVFISLLLLSELVDSTGITEVDVSFPWTLAASFLLFFAIFNSVYSLTATDDNTYWTKSFFSFAGMAILSGGIAYFFAGISMDEVGPYKWIYIVITFVYLVFISIIGFMKRIVQFAQKEEWTKPMRKSKKRN